MSVVIKVDTPKTCAQCLMSCRISSYQVLCKYDMNEHTAMDTNCPILCELPKNHGDLIDRKELLKNYGLDNCAKYGNQTKEQQRHRYDTLRKYEIADMIEDAETVIEAEGEE